ncbi:ligand-binding protein SH3 [Sedimenticola sp.]|uniref:ligand-binding protein SH3 n=1 Tax=Sedimenticola sp. TaxID=1940285 RepID=UPI003D10E83A
MFDPITIPYGVVMLFNVVKLKEGIQNDDVELALGEMCNTVKNTYGNKTGGFIGGQVFEYTGFVSAEGSFDPDRKSEEHLVIITYWHSFEQHERSHADHAFKEKFRQLTEYCSDTYELGYKMLWQGMAD